MKHIVYVLLIVMLSNCGTKDRNIENANYPSIILMRKLQSEYKTACMAMYSINSCCECNCMALNLKNKNNDLNILELDLKLVTLLEKKDTFIFYFNFYQIDSYGDTLIFQTLSKDYSSCMYNGIAVLKNGNQYFPTILGDHEVTNVDKNFIASSQKQFQKCLSLGNIKPSETLNKLTVK